MKHQQEIRTLSQDNMEFVCLGEQVDPTLKGYYILRTASLEGADFELWEHTPFAMRNVAIRYGKLKIEYSRDVEPWETDLLARLKPFATQCDQRFWDKVDQEYLADGGTFIHYPRDTKPAAQRSKG